MSTGAYPLVVSQNLFIRRLESQKAGKPAPAIPADWPVDGWEGADMPVDASLPAVCQWLALGSRVLKNLAHLDRANRYNKRRLDNSKKVAGSYFRDGKRLLRALGRIDLIRPCKENPNDVFEFLQSIEQELQKKKHGLEKARKKRSTERGEGRTKLIAALTRHHQYANGGCLNLEPIGNNELARKAHVAKRTASRFFAKEFEGHRKYQNACTDAATLITAMKMLNDEFAPHILYGTKPPDKKIGDDE